MTAKKVKAAEIVPEPTVFGPDNGGNAIIRAWQGLYHLFGARVERFDVTPEGVYAVNLTVDEKYGTPEEIVAALPYNPKARLDFFPTYLWVNGEIPANFTSSLDLTGWLTRHMKEPGKKGRSPKFAKDAIQDYKNAVGLAVPRGRPRRTFKITELGNLDPEALEGIEISELTRLQETLNSVLSSTPVEVTA